MFRLLIVASCLGLALGLPSRGIPKLDGKIVGGEDTEIENYPYQISLQSYGSHICGGTIINKNHVVTAAHCTYLATASSLSIRAGSSIREEGGQVIQVKTIHQNPDFVMSTFNFDVSVLELDGDIILNDKAQPVVLGGYEPSTGKDAVCTGWGATSSGGSAPKQLQRVTVQIVSRSECKERYGESKITNRMICASAPGKDACQGDSGGPLAIDGVLFGIVSWGRGCADSDYPGVYSNVADLIDFIVFFA